MEASAPPFIARSAGGLHSYEDYLALPDDVIYLFADLEPGTYVALCTIPQGTIGHDLGDGPPHFTLGMAHELTVG